MRIRDFENELIAEHVRYIHYGQVTPRTIFCVITLHDDWEIYGVSSCKDMDNFNAIIGRQYALKHALSKLQEKLDKRTLVQ